MAGRNVIRVVRGRDTFECAGVRLKRTLGGPEIDRLGPFLLLDEFKSEDANDCLAGFPDHPHRGFETVTYMLAGAVEHRDSRGNRGKLVAGSVLLVAARPVGEPVARHGPFVMNTREEILQAVADLREGHMA